MLFLLAQHSQPHLWLHFSVGGGTDRRVALGRFANACGAFCSDGSYLIISIFRLHHFVYDIQQLACSSPVHKILVRYDVVMPLRD